MTQLYRAEAYERITEDGVGVYLQVGEPLTIDGTPMVRMSAGGYIAPAAGWHPTKAQAFAAAAVTVEAWGKRMLEQAARLRHNAQPIGDAVRAIQNAATRHDAMVIKNRVADEAQRRLRDAGDEKIANDAYFAEWGDERQKTNVTPPVTGYWGD
jgi:hypothetical protein